MTEVKDNSLESILFPKGTDFGQTNIQSQILEQYKLFVQTSETLVARRQTANTFFLSVNSFLLAAIGLLAKGGLTTPGGGLGIAALGFAGILLSIAWQRLVRSYRQLNSGKFEIIHLLEQHLPARMFKAEWEALGTGRDKKKYTPFTRTEGAIPCIFGVLYGLAVIGGVVAIVHC